MIRKIGNAVMAIAVLSAGIPLACADSVELVNGDLLHGKVVSLDDRDLRLVSDIHGAVIIARDKVAAIGLGDRKIARPKTAADIADTAGDAQAVVRRNSPADGRTTVTATVPVAPGSVQDVVRQLRAQGLSVDNVNEIQKAFPELKEQPGVKKYFDEKMQGLIKGDVSVEDIRKDAVRVREELRKTAKSLGPDGEKTLNQALGGYLQILDKFIRESESKQADTSPGTPATKAPENERTDGAAKNAESEKR
jgi:hypothetical protein